MDFLALARTLSSVAQCSTSDVIRECYSRLYDIVKEATLRVTEDQIVIFEPDSKVLYLFSGTRFNQIGSYKDFIGVLNNKNVGYVSDNRSDRMKVLARTVTTLSPRKTNGRYEFGRFHDFLKVVTFNR